MEGQKEQLQEKRGEGIRNVSKTSTGGLHFKNVVFVLLARSEKREGGGGGRRGRSSILKTLVLMHIYDYAS